MKLNTNVRQFLLISLIVFIILSLSTIVLLWRYSYYDALRIVFGSAYVVFLPGFIWTYVFFRKDSLDVLERIVLSVGLSFVLVPTVLFFINSYGFAIEFAPVFSSILLLCVFGLAISIISKVYNRFVK